MALVKLDTVWQCVRSVQIGNDDGIDNISILLCLLGICKCI